MFKIIPKTDCNATTLNHNENIFHDALAKKENYYHVITKNGKDYDISFVKNDDTMPEHYRNIKKGLEIYPQYFHYDENATDTLELSLLKDVRYIFCQTLNEYSVVVARLALKHTSAEIYFLNPLADIFFEKNERLHIVEKFPAFDKNETLQIIDAQFFAGFFESNFLKISSVPAFHSIFFWQSLTDLNISDVKYVEVPIAKNVGVGGILSYYAQAKNFFLQKGWQTFMKENSTRYDDEMLRRYFKLDVKPKDANLKNTIYLTDVIKVASTYLYSKFNAEIDVSILTDSFRAEMDEYTEVVLGNKKVLGVLIRGTDYIVTKMGGARKMATVAEMLPLIHEWINSDGYDLIFLATEDKDILNQMKKEFGSKIRIVSQVRHSVSDFVNVKLLSDLENKEQSNNSGLVEDSTVNYFYALYILSKCQSFMASGQCHGWNVVNSFNKGKFKRCYKFQVGIDE